MTQLVGNKIVFQLFSSKFRFRVEIGHLGTFITQELWILGG